jgi:protein SCO1
MPLLKTNLPMKRRKPVYNKHRLWFCSMVTLISLAFCTAFTGRVLAQVKENLPKGLEGVAITQNLDAQIPLDLEFTDSSGKKITLGQLFDGKLPTILTMNYSDCPMLCSLQLNGLIDAIKPMNWTLGEEYQIITVSIDPL